MPPARQCPVWFALQQRLHWVTWQHPEPRSNQAGGSSCSSHGSQSPIWPSTASCLAEGSASKPSCWAGKPRDPVTLCCGVSRDDNLLNAERQLCVNIRQTALTGETNDSVESIGLDSILQMLGVQASPVRC